MLQTNKVGAIVVHGFNSCTEDVKTLVDYLNKHGIYAISPCLTGENGSRKAWRSTSYEDWIKNAEKEFLNLRSQCDKIIAIGYSMGGLIAMNLVEKYGADLLITISTPIYYANIQKIFRNIKEGIKQKNMEPLRHYAEVVRNIPINGALNFKRFLQMTIPLVDHIRVPVLVMQGLNDDIVQWKSADYIFNHVKSPKKKKIYYRNCDHSIFCSKQKNDVCEEILHYTMSQLFYENIENTE